MHHGICVTYSYSGDEAAWEDLVESFIAAVSADSALAGRFTYHVHKAKDGGARVHIGRWDSPETVALMQSRPYFPVFAAGLRSLAGDTLKATPFTLSHSAVPA